MGTAVAEVWLVAGTMTAEVETDTCMMAAEVLVAGTAPAEVLPMPVPTHLSLD